MKRCKTCAHWTDYSSSRKWETDHVGIGTCDSRKFTYNELTLADGLNYVDAEYYAASFSTGKDFGCIHWRLKS